MLENAIVRYTSYSTLFYVFGEIIDQMFNECIEIGL